ncbi:type VI secretion system-associated FHA domain protein TagH [Paraburkholderia sp. DHOC27]|uniref:type VI secretion system-associated FHA domain protein TagH n=1 Tax=Paraburkholderia sp. DHOC27 TaxID=2303330 RepID=UPI000E3C9268|nr:type VI secretion system-associated FHA domain protein TagH [Paraburkholderia sp. DHOC27]RFU48321.1 type VI secretion system-associated FHA domain protein TagH [Paraburkholderia sp. DHOC27]
MLTLTVTHFNGKPPLQRIAATFDNEGGTIGRAETNQLVLEDAERTVSRVHAQIVWREGRYRLIDRGSNPALVNGTPLEPGEEIVVAEGDEVQIGGYQLRATLDGDREPLNSNADPFADIFGDAAPASPTQRKGYDPDDLDELLRPAPDRVDAVLQPQRPSSLLPDDLDLGLNDPVANRSIDELFDLGPGADLDSLDHRDPRDLKQRGSPIDDPLCAPNTANDADPFASLTASKRADAPPPTQPDRGSELHSAFPLPRMRQAQAQTQAQAQPKQPRDAERHEPTWRNADEAPPADQRALLEAFLHGLAAPHLRIDALSPALMQLIGTLLREATQGTLDLLVARAATRREMRTDATMIVATGNNPLKFSPDVETALGHLLNAPTRGFMPAPVALADAYDDLRAHQVGFVAGMRAALDGVFERFEPARIEARLTQHSLLDALLPNLNRRAQCWNLFADLYAQLSREAADDFHALFGKAFVEAYEAQIDRLKQRKP